MCGIIGLYHKKNPVCGEIYDSLIQVQHRGQDAAGISTLDNSKISTHKEIGLVSQVFKHQEIFDNLSGNIGIGHVRYPTAGGENVNEAQPFYTANPVNISLAHNGTLTNSEILKENLEKERIQKEVIITEIRDNIVWTDLNVKYLLADIKTFIDSHKTEIDILLFIELFKPVNSNKNKLIANEIDVNNIEALEKLLLDNDSYKKIRFKSLLDRRAKELYELDLSVKELKYILQV